MSPESLDRVRAIVLGAAALPVSERATYLDRICGDDRSLRTEVESLLAFDDDPAGDDPAGDDTGGAIGLGDIGFQRESAEPPAPADEVPSPADPSLAPGAMLSRFRVIERLDPGGMSEIYRAEDTRLVRPVILKFLPRDRLGDETARRRMLREARAASSLDHPHIGIVHGIESDASGRQFIVMADYGRQTLKVRIAQGPIPLPQAIAWMRQILGGLDAAHRAGIVHRDLKPSNIMVCADGSARIIDFGIAHCRHLPRLTRTGVRPGTLAYMSPEQIGDGTVDGRSDLYSAGLLLYEMLARRLPYPGTDLLQVVQAVLQGDLTPISRYVTDPPADLVAVLDQALATKRSRRFASAADMSAALARIEENRGESSRKPAWRIRSPRLWIPVVLLIAALAAHFLTRSTRHGLESLHPAEILAIQSSVDRDFAFRICGAGDFNGDGYDDFLISDNPAGVNSRCQVGLYAGGLAPATEPLLVFDAQLPRDQFGRRMCCLGDFNGDGCDDFAIAAPHEFDERTRISPQTQVYFGGTPQRPGDGQADLLLDGLGTDIAGPVDLNGDGSAEIVVSAEWAAPRHHRSGCIAIFMGRPTPAGPETLSIADADWLLEGGAAEVHLGKALAAIGDVNGDGIDDFAAGARRESEIRIYCGSTDDQAQLDRLTARLTDDRGRRLWPLMAGPGDLDGDGIDDITALARGESSWELLVFYGAADPQALGGAADHVQSIAPLRSGPLRVPSGGRGDLDGDGCPDLVVGQPNYSGSADGTGRLLAIAGRPTRPAGGEEFRIFAVPNTSEWQHTGQSLAWIGDIDGSGAANLAVRGRPAASVAPRTLSPDWGVRILAPTNGRNRPR